MLATYAWPADSKPEADDVSNYKRLRELIDAPEILAMPGIFDGSSSRPTQLPGFAAGLLSGEGIGEASLGWADQGIMGLEGNLLVGIVICPQLLTAGAIPGMNNAIAALNVSLLTGEVVGRPDLLVPFEASNDLVAIKELQRLDAVA